MKPMCIIQGPVATRSGYGDMARDIARHIIELDLYDVKIVSTPWGATPLNALSLDNPKDAAIIQRIQSIPMQLSRQPELFIQISVPSEFQPLAKYNIGITAGIETTMCSAEWLQGCNRMDVIWTISEHSKNVFANTTFEQRDQMGRSATLRLERPIEVLHNCVDTAVFKKLDAREIPASVANALIDVKEKFCYLFVGHWLTGNIGEDRKNVGLLVQIFCETFKNTVSANRPALILKTSGAGFSIIDQEQILSKIRQIREASGPTAPNVYLLHGELSEAEMNGLYNHPKVKVHVSFTKGEGFGRPLLEATMSQKPVIASGWSGVLDFLNKDDALLVGGELRKIEPGAVWPGVIIPESEWFNVDPAIAAKALMYAFKKYDEIQDRPVQLAKKNKVAFSYDTIKERTAQLLKAYVPEFEMPKPLKLPTLKKLTKQADI